MISGSGVMTSIGVALTIVGVVTSAQALSVSADPQSKTEHNNLTSESVSRSGHSRPPHPGDAAQIARERMIDVPVKESEGSP